MAELYREFGKQGLQMVAVSSEDLQTVRDYAGSARYPFTILVDSEDVLSQRFGIDAIPDNLYHRQAGPPRLSPHRLQ